MKIRAGFVSNSSTSSFIAFGVTTDQLPMTPTDQDYLNNFDFWFKHYQDNPQWADKTEFGKMEKASENPEMKLWYAKNTMDYDKETFYNRGEFKVGGWESQLVGIKLDTLLKNHPNLFIGDIKILVAEELNKQFGTTFTKEDIEYFEEVWNDN
jgi:hypothetical protein